MRWRCGGGGGGGGGWCTRCRFRYLRVEHLLVRLPRRLPARSRVRGRAGREQEQPLQRRRLHDHLAHLVVPREEVLVEYLKLQALLSEIEQRPREVELGVELRVEVPVDHARGLDARSKQHLDVRVGHAVGIGWWKPTRPYNSNGEHALLGEPHAQRVI